MRISSSGRDTEGAVSVEASEALDGGEITVISNAGGVQVIRLRTLVPDTYDVRVFDTVGREVRRLFGGALATGVHDIVWNARDGSGRTVRNGIYFIRVASGHGTEVRKVVIVR